MNLAQMWSDPSGATPATIQDIEVVVAKVFEYFLAFAAIALFFLLVVGGYKMITSGGDPGKLQGAWKTVTFAILGIVLIVASFLILRFITAFTGVDVTNFNLNFN
jgi:hypothetical protein